ncbi:MAG: hypothetical protein ACTHLJ_16665 [Angustibacter sp.]
MGAARGSPEPEHEPEPGADVEAVAPAPPDDAHPSDTLDSVQAWLTTVQGVAAVVAALTGVLFVVLNAGYVHFYESVGVRPEDVGVDKVGVLARTAGLIPVLYAAGWACWLVLRGLLQVGAVALWVLLGACGVSLVAGALWTRWMTAVGLALFAVLSLAYALWSDGVPVARLGYATIAAFALVLAALVPLRLLTDARIDAVRSGQPVTPVALQGGFLPIVDVWATRARATWVTAGQPAPAPLADPALLYPGHGSRGDVFVACGHALVVPSGAVVLETGLEAREGPDAADRSRICHAAEDVRPPH